MDCGKLTSSINSLCATPSRQFERTAWVAPYDSIYDVVITNNKVVFKTRTGFVPIYDRSPKPFNGTKIVGEQGDYFVKFTETVQFPVLSNDHDNAEAIEAITKGKVVVILESVEKGTNDTSRYVAFGINGGLQVLNANSDATTDIAWLATLENKFAQYASLFVYDTDKAGTDLLISKFTTYDWISGTVATNPVNISWNTADYGYFIQGNGTYSGGLSPTSTTYSGTLPAILTVLVPKASSVTSFGNTPFSGEVRTLLTGTITFASTLITKLVAENATGIVVTNVSALSNLVTKEATSVSASGCALTADSIANILRNAVLTGATGGTIIVSGGTNALYGTWSATAQADTAILVSRSWTVTYSS